MLWHVTAEWEGGLWQLYGELAKHGLTADQAALLKGSASRGAKATRRQELAHALRLERAGLAVDPELGLHQLSGQARASSGTDAAEGQQPVTFTNATPSTDMQLDAQQAQLSADDRQLQNEDAISRDEQSSDSEADLAADTPPTKRQKLDTGPSQSGDTAAAGSHAGSAQMPDVEHLWTAVQQSRAELGLPGEDPSQFPLLKDPCSSSASWRTPPASESNPQYSKGVRRCRALHESVGRTAVLLGSARIIFTGFIICHGSIWAKAPWGFLYRKIACICSAAPSNQGEGGAHPCCQYCLQAASSALPAQSTRRSPGKTLLQPKKAIAHMMHGRVASLLHHLPT